MYLQLRQRKLIEFETNSYMHMMTFEDWTDVMYETMAVHPSSWFYYLSFIFLSAFAFLNMVIGIVVGTLEEEHRRLDQELHPEPSMSELKQEISELKDMVAALALERRGEPG